MVTVVKMVNVYTQLGTLAYTGDVFNKIYKYGFRFEKRSIDTNCKQIMFFFKKHCCQQRWS